MYDNQRNPRQWFESGNRNQLQISIWCLYVICKCQSMKQLETLWHKKIHKILEVNIHFTPNISIVHIPSHSTVQHHHLFRSLKSIHTLLQQSCVTNIDHFYNNQTRPTAPQVKLKNCKYSSWCRDSQQLKHYNSLQCIGLWTDLYLYFLSPELLIQVIATFLHLPLIPHLYPT